MTKIVFLDQATIGEVPNLREIETLGQFIAYPNTPPSEVLNRLAGATVAISNKVVLSRAVLAKLPALKLICVAATGMNNVDLEAAKKYGVAVRNVAGYSTNSVAQLTIAALFNLSMDLMHLNQAVYDGTYSRQPNFAYWRQPFYELRGKTYGIIGMGTIGQQVAALVTAFGATVVYYSTSGQNTAQPYRQIAQLDDLLAICDAVSIHAPLNAQTKDLITYRELSKMQTGAYLLNMGRGGIVNEADLVSALDDGCLAGAAVDVFTEEPLSSDHPYLQVTNKERLLLTPHIGWASAEARMELVAGIIANIKLGW